MDTLSRHQRPKVRTSVGSSICRYALTIPIPVCLLLMIGAPLVVAMLPGTTISASQVTTAMECESLARVVAHRNYSMLEGDSLRKTQLSAYRTCVADPLAFRRMLR